MKRQTELGLEIDRMHIDIIVRCNRCPGDEAAKDETKFTTRTGCGWCEADIIIGE